MQLGMIGLGRMGANMSRRLTAAGHEVVGHDISQEAVDALESEGVIVGSASVEDLCSKLSTPRRIWVMVPAAVADRVIDGLIPHLEEGDTVIDGGNSFYRDDVDRYDELAPQGIHHLDVGVSGGVFGLERGYCLMIGGDPEPVEALSPIFDTLAPGVDAGPRTEGRSGPPSPAENGWLHCGPAGAGHFVKMVHNGIEYGVMAAYAEGFAVLSRAGLGREGRVEDAETAPLRDPHYYQFDFDLPDIAEVWRRGSVIGSWLLDLTAAALLEDPGLEDFAGHVSDSGEGRWTVQAAVDLGVPINVLASSLNQRFSSRDQGDYGDKLLSAMREQFGGHKERSG
jgi:6-phosphogluconate dehydrogenase